MIETAFAQPQMQSTPREDAGYKSWQAAARHAVMRRDLNDRTAGPMPSFGSMVHHTALAAQDMNYAPDAASAPHEIKPDLAYAGEKEGFNFGDIIDIINPLQHLPVIGTLYRKFTGDEIKSFSSIIGGAIFGGPVGAVSSTANAVIKESTGKDIAENALSLVGIESAPARKPDIVIAEPVNFTAEIEKSLAVANLYEKTAAGQKNFAAKDAAYSWNI